MAYNGKTSLFVTYTWANRDSKAIVNKEFSTLDEAVEEMSDIMPRYKIDDGYIADKWDELIAKGEEEDVFLQLCAYVGEDRYFLAQLRPIV